MEIFLAVPEGNIRKKFFSEEILQSIRELGNLRMNQYGRVMTEEELAVELASAEVCIVVAWGGCPQFTPGVLDRAPALKLIISPAASVAGFITDRVYERNIKVCSANDVMAKYVAEGTLAYMLAALREIPLRNAEMKNGVWHNLECDSLINKKIGLVGLGAVGRHLIKFLKPFAVRIQVYDPYIKKESLASHENVSLCSLEEVLAANDIISVHASKTEETYHLLNKERLALMKAGALLVNTARGAIIDEKALITELKSGRICAVLDVYEKDGPLPENSVLRTLENVILMPHTAGLVRLMELTRTMVKEMQRYKKGEPLQYEIPIEQYRRMTR